MRAEVKSVMSSDIDLAAYSPSDPSNAGEWIRFLVGPYGEQGEESLDIYICTPQAIACKVLSDGPDFLRSHFVMGHMDMSAAIREVTSRINSINGNDWADVGNQLSRIGHWEFEQYREGGH